ncbi:uncharacterized protein BDR25DRAFT_314453 [Lindgomyces ingoldianus]|uniref:Uncharacterized protein n=1 Tax=Lindgomyces ingoldianus TaxID=673940 RepID=A0ACB6QX50_9PLEO|nr:uncharacterized protein BDR25DRAFT_314453 [Lindgomyces ingoldianus]KAF2470781.1 hypothetical protein BDR25DRAFT_314453 [Lindgomyces ingoldianus]
MSNSSVTQVPFNAFKLIDFGPSLSLKVYQQLYNDNAEPIGVIAIVQSLGLLRPVDEAIDQFNGKWTRGSTTWEFCETGIEVVTGQSSTSNFMAKTRAGEAAVMVLSLLLECMDARDVSEIVRLVIDSSPNNLVQIKPRKTQIKNVVTTIESQTSCISWQEEIMAAQVAVLENSPIWTRDQGPVSSDSFEIPNQCMAAYFQALCAVTNFPDFRCTLHTGGSISLPFLLAHTVCGLRVCVTVNGELVFGNASSDAWQVRLEKSLGQKTTRVKFGQTLNDIQDLLVLDETGKPRANRIDIHGIGKIATIGQALGEREANDIAILVVCVASSILTTWKREVHDHSNPTGSLDYESDSSTASTKETSESKACGEIKRRLTPKAVALWWGCSELASVKMMDEASRLTDLQPTEATWRGLRYSKTTMANIADFEGLSKNEQSQRRLRENKPLSREDYASLTHTLTTYLVLISFLCFNETSKTTIRVRSSSRPQNSAIGRTLRCMRKPKPLAQSDILGSWYYWVRGSGPKSLDNVDAFVVDGFLIYRNLLLQLDLSPEACETVVVEAGHLQFQGYRAELIRSSKNSTTVIGNAASSNLSGPCILRSRDMTGHVDTRWSVDEVQGSLELGLTLECGNSGIQIETSVSNIAKESWSILYGDRTIDCSHDEGFVGRLVEGEVVEELVPGSHHTASPPGVFVSGYRDLKLYRAHRNELGQIACLMSSQGHLRGILRRDACLRCCVSYAERAGLDFLID